MLTNGSSQAGQCWQGREDRGLCRSLALLNLMLTDSNEDSLLARIERRREEGMVLHYTSQDLLSKPLCTHVLSEIQTTQAHTHKNTCLMCSRQTRANASLGCVISVLSKIKPICSHTKKCSIIQQQFCGFLFSCWKRAGIQ